MILAADFGGTTIKLGIIRGGTIAAQLRLAAEAERPMMDRLEVVACAWEKLLAEGGETVQECRGIALALPFLVDSKKSRVLGEFGKFPGAAAIDFAAWSEKRFGFPAVVENDVRVALLGEWKAGAARGKGEVLMLALGTGIGCAVISSNRLLRGAHNRAATLLGHGTVSHEGSRGRCGNIGCAEDLASTATLEVRARNHANFVGSELARIKKIDFETLFKLAAHGDACSEALLRQSLSVWAVVLQNAILAYDPEIVVLGGGILRSREVIMPFIEEHLRRYMPGLPFDIPIVAAALGDNAALLGAEVLFQETYPELFL